MRKITVDLYTIDELKNVNEKAYNKVLDDAREDIIDCLFNFDASLDCKETLKEKYNLIIDEKNIYYSISYCQGDGVCFTDRNILSYYNIKNKSNLNAFEKWIIDNLNDNDLNMLLEYLNCNYNLNIIKKDHRYCHCDTCIIDYEYFYSSDDPNYVDDMNDFIDKLCDELFNNVYVNMCADLEQLLYSFYDVDDDEIIDHCNANEYYYTISGELYPL